MTGRQGVRTGSGKLHQQMLVSLLFACHATASCCSMSPCYIYNYSKTPRGASVTANSYFWIFPPTLHAETTQTFRAQILSFAFRIRPQTLRRPAGPAYCTWWSVCSLPVSCLSCLLSKLLPWFKQAPPAFPGPFLSSFHLNFSSGQFLFPFLFRNLAVPLPQSLLPWLPHSDGLCSWTVGQNIAVHCSFWVLSHSHREVTGTLAGLPQAQKEYTASKFSEHRARKTHPPRCAESSEMNEQTGQWKPLRSRGLWSMAGVDVQKERTQRTSLDDS